MINNKKVLILVSVASMIKQFNMNNIKILLDLGYQVEVVADFSYLDNIDKNYVDSLIDELNSMSVKIHNISIPRTLSIKRIFCSYNEVKKLIYNNDYYFIHCQSPIGSAILRLAARKTKTKIIYTAHGFHFYKGSSIINWLIFFPVEYYLSKFTDCLITINNTDYEFAKKIFKAKNNVFVPGIGIDLNKFYPKKNDYLRKEFHLSSDDKILLSVGELGTNKNHIVVLKTLSMLNDNRIHYFIVGNGKLYNEFIDFGNKYSINLHLLGFRNDMFEIYNSADAFVFPSFREGLPVSLMEAMACGVVCIASKIRGNIDLLDSQHSYLVENNSIESYADAIKSALYNSNTSFVEYNLNKIKDFSVDKVNNIMREIYKNI